MSRNTTTTTEILITTRTTEAITPEPQSPEPEASPPNMPTVTEPHAPDTPSPQTKKMYPEHSSIMSNGVESQDGESEATNRHEEGAPTETGGPVTASVEGGEGEEEDDGSDVVPVGTVNEHGEVVGSGGEILGKVEGDVPEGSMVDTEGDVIDHEGNVIGKADVEGATKDAKGAASEAKDGVEKPDAAGTLGEAAEGVEKPDAEGTVGEAAEGLEKPDAEGTLGDAAEGVEKPDAEGAVGEAAEGVKKPELAGPFGVQDNGEVTNAQGVPIGQLAEGEPQDLVGRSIKEVDEEGNLKTEGGSVIGKVELNPEVLDKGEEAAGELGEKPAEGEEAVGELGEKAPEVPEGEEAAGELGDKAAEGEKAVPSEMVPEGGEPTVLGDALEEAKPELDYSILDGLKVNKLGKVVKEDGTQVGHLIEGDPKKLAGKKIDAEGNIWNDSGKVIGRCEPLPETIEGEITAPFEDFPGAVVTAKGDVEFEGRVIGKIIEGDPKKLEGKKVDADGDIIDKNGNTIGKAERFQEEEPEPEAVPEPEDVSDLEGKKVNKAGNVVDDNGKRFGRVVSGDLAKLIGRKCDAEGKIYSDSGKVIGTAELIPADDREGDSGALFEDFPDSIVDSKGNILFEGQIVGKLIEGDAKKLAGKKIDKDGEVVDKIGNVLGKAERWTEPDEPEPEVVDNSALAGKRVNKLGNVVDSSGVIFGRLIQGDPRKIAGRMCDKNGNVLSEGGDIIGKAELVPESEREGVKTGPFADFANPTVVKDGKVADAKGTIIGRLIQGDAKVLFGKPVDDDGDVLDKNGNTLGKAERWEEEEKTISKHPAAGRKVNKKGEVVDENGDTIAKLTDGDIQKCAGKEIDNDGDVKDQKGMVVGHVTLIEDIPEPEPEPEQPKESEEEIAERKQLEADRKLAGQLASCVEQSIDKIKPILKMITDTITTAEAQPKDELDEQKLVDTVKPLIEEGSQILTECNGAVRALDPDGRIQSQSKQKTASRDASPEEYRLADQLKELSSSVMTTIEQAKKKIAGMPHAKKELNPLWGLLAEPLGQIIAAVGLLLSGVLGLVGRLLSGLGLGGLLDNLLGGLGIKGILQGLGLGMVTKSLTGKK